MNKQISNLVAFFLLFFIILTSCDDKVEYDLIRPESGPQKVLVEEVSGVRCPNCPDGTRLLDALQKEFDSSLVVVTFHAGSFSFPYSESKYDFKTDQTVELLQKLGSPLGYPAAIIQRTKASQGDGYPQLSNTWSSSISNALSVEPKIRINLETVITADEHVKLIYNLLFLEKMDGPVFTNIYLLEDGLIDYQADLRDDNGVVEKYEHNHVLKQIITPINGEILGNSFDILETYTDSITLDLKSYDNIEVPQNTSLIVFITRDDKVLQVEKAYNYP